MKKEKKRFELFRLFQDGMILQRNADVGIWGFAEPGTKVKSDFHKEGYSGKRVNADNNMSIIQETVTGDDGRFFISIKTGEAGGPYEMVVSKEAEKQDPGDSGETNMSDGLTGNDETGSWKEPERIIIRDILLGDVYLLNGQSNMELQVGRILDHVGHEPERIHRPRIREFRVPIKPAFGEQIKQFDDGRWLVADGKDIYDMSAVGAYFAMYVQDAEDIPVGLVNVSVGGTPIEAHLPEEELNIYKIYDEEMEKNKDKEYVARTERDDMARIEDWYRRLDENDTGMKSILNTSFENAGEDNADQNTWKQLDVPQHFRGTELDGFIGSVWFEREFEIPDYYPLSGAMLRLGAIIDADAAYINGVQVGNTEYMYPPRRYEVPDGVLKHGKNVLDVRLIINRNCGGFVKDKSYSLSWDENKTERIIDLSGEWKYKKGAGMEELPLQTFFCYKPSAIYNGMIYPILNCTFKGSLWYQGESNEGNVYDYTKLMLHLIKCYHEWFGEDFPFYFVQLPQFYDPAGFIGKDGWAKIREAQRAVITTCDDSIIPKTAMAVTIDIGESNDLHPQLKPEVAFRLFLCAEALIYGKDVEYSGPVVTGTECVDNEITVHFSHCEGGIDLRNTENFEVGFDVDGVFDIKRTWSNNDRLREFEKLEWHTADDVRLINNNVVVKVPDGPGEKAAAIRYCYTNDPKSPSIYNKSGLPASPFETALN